MPFLITTVLDGTTETDAILNLDLCFAFARDPEGRTVAMTSTGTRLTIGMGFKDLQTVILELNAMEFGEGEGDDGPGLKVELK